MQKRSLMTVTHTNEQNTAHYSIWKEIAILFLLFLISFVAVFGLYNPLTVDLFDMIAKIPSEKERYANYAIMAMIVFMFGVLQTVNMKKKDAIGKIGVVVFIIVTAAAILATVLYFTTSLLYPLLSLLLIGFLAYMLDLMFVTIGPKGFFAFTLLFGMGLVGLYKIGVHAPKTLVTLAELSLVLILFIAATYPRIKSLLFHIGTRDNIDISNESDETGENSEE